MKASLISVDGYNLMISLIGYFGFSSYLVTLWPFRIGKLVVETPLPLEMITVVLLRLSAFLYPHYVCYSALFSSNPILNVLFLVERDIFYSMKHGSIECSLFGLFTARADQIYFLNGDW